MPSPPLSQEVKGLVDRANFAHLATLRKDGSPQVDPVWIGREGDRLLVGTGERTRKARNARRDPRVSLSIVDFQDPYEEAMLRGRVVEHRPDADLRVMDEISRKYTGKEFPWRSPQGRVVLVIEISSATFRKLPLQHTPPRR
jgi:PPOX class probable F420-dependent enzyme